MYATAHRVSTPQGDSGINAFLHLHGVTAPLFDWSTIDRIADRETGVLAAEHLEIVPGSGNKVLSYLDLACPDDTPQPRIVEALRHMQQTLFSQQRTNIRQYPPVIVVRFDNVGGLGVAEVSEFEALRLALEQILEQRPRPAWMDKQPLVVQVHRDGNNMMFRLDNTARGRVATAHDVQLPLGIVHIEVDTLAVFERLHGDLIRQILPVLTGLSLERIREEGGARVLRAEDGKLLWEWPLRS